MKKGGFTLIELLVVIAIIGLLSSVVMASLNQTRARARDSKKIQEVKEVIKALELYKADYGYYPPGGNISNGYTASNLTNLRSALVPNYIANISNDIRYLGRYIDSGESQQICCSPPVGSQTACGSNAPCTNFHVGITLEDDTAAPLNSDSDVATWTGGYSSQSVNGKSYTCDRGYNTNTPPDKCLDYVF